MKGDKKIFKNETEQQKSKKVKIEMGNFWRNN
jgi:hypothetical protein